MKPIAPFILLIATTIMAGCFAGKSRNSLKGKIYIKDVRTGTPPGEDLVKYHHEDVDVFRVSPGGSGGYRVYYYRRMADTLRCFQAQYNDTSEMDMGTYRWENDSLVAIRLYSTTSGYELRFKVFGNMRDGRKISGMMADKMEQ